MAASSLVDIANQILKAATTLQQQLNDKNLPQPSFASTGPLDYHDAAEFSSILEARAELIEASQSMLRLAKGPTDVVRSLVGTDRTNIMVLGAIDKLKIAEAVPLDSSIAIEELASKLQLHSAPLQRVLSYAYTMNMFHEPKPGHVAHTSISAAVSPFSPYTWLTLHPSVGLGSMKLAESLRISAGQTDADQPSNLVHLAQPQYNNFWDVIRDEPEGMTKFSAAMRVVGQAIVGPKYTQYLRGFDWASLGKATVVDLGGGNGHISIALARAHPNLTIIIQDLATNTAPALATIPTDLKARVSFQAQDFFSPQPSTLIESPPAVYLLSRVLHDWADHDCVRILTELLPAVEHGVRLFVVDRVVPDQPAQLPLHQEAWIRNMDLLMYSLLGGRERCLADWQAVLKATDPRLVVLRVDIPVASEFALLELGFR